MREKDLYIALGAVIHEERVARGLYLHDLSVCTGLTVQTLSLIEAGKVRCQLHILCALADRLDVPAGELLSAARLRCLARALP